MPEEEKEKKVIDYWVDDEGWNLGKLRQILPEEYLKKLNPLCIVPGNNRI